MSSPGVGVSAPGRAPLGIHAESAPARGSYKGGVPPSVRGTVHDPGVRRRWRLLAAAGALLDDKVPRINRDGQEVAHYLYRVAMCYRALEGGVVTIKRSLDCSRAEFSSVQTCGSQWHCPICAPKIAARRVMQINMGIKRWHDEGGGVYLATYTHHHDSDSSGQGQCRGAADRLAQALSYYKGKRPYRRFMEGHGGVGVVRSLESSYGEMNGFHHHTHEIVFAGRGLLVLDRQGVPVRWLSPLYRLRATWARVLVKFELAGLSMETNERGERVCVDYGVDKFRKLRHLLTRCLDARDGRYAAEYVAKLGKEPESWGLASELAKSHLKVGQGRPDRPRRCGHASPWELLNDALDGDERSGVLWREWAVAFQGRARLYWSPGLLARFGIPDVSDIELARAPDSRCVQKVAELGPWEWKLVLSHNARFELLRAAAVDGELGVKRLLLQLAAAPPAHGGDFIIFNHDPPPRFALYQTPDGATHQYWGR